MDSVTCAFCHIKRPCTFCGGTGYLPRFWAMAPLVDYQLSRCDVCGAIRVTGPALGHEHICATCALNLADAVLTSAAMAKVGAM